MDGWIGSLLALTLAIGTLLSSTSASAADEVVDNVSIKVNTSCTMSATGNIHSAEINNGNYRSEIGTTVMRAFCNDAGGFSIFAIGYTDGEDGKTTLTSSINSAYDISTGTATSGDTSNWAMKLVSDSSATYPITLQNGFGSYREVPEVYTRAASRNSGTDLGTSATGATLTSTYATYISPSQSSGGYHGKVKYTMVHPISSFAAKYSITYNANTTDTVTDLPEVYYGSSTSGTATLSSTKPQREGYAFYGWCATIPDGLNCAGDSYRAGTEFPLVEDSENGIELYAIWGTYSMLDTGSNVNAKMKSLAAGASVTSATATSDIKAIRMADTLPADFVASEENTISISDTPTYIYYDNTNDAGIIYVYTEADKVQGNANSNNLFRKNTMLTDISEVADWDMQNVTNMFGIFNGATSLSDISALAGWDTSSVTNMSGIFYGATSLSDISALANWDTSSVTIMSSAFRDVTSLSDISALAHWDTSGVTNMFSIFNGATSLSDISALTGWDTSSVTNMNSMFYGATSLSDISALANWDTSSVMNMYSMFYGATSLSDISGLDNWDTSSVTTMNSMFNGDINLSDISALSNWDTSSVTTMQNMFWNTERLSDLSPLANWDTHNVTNMAGFMGVINMMRGGGAAIDLTPLANWDVSNVTSMLAMFQGCNIPSFQPLSRWNVGKVQDFSYMFNHSYVSSSKRVATSLSGLENWDVSSATNMQWMFASMSSLQDVSALDNWNVANVNATAGFYRMLINVSPRPNFTKRAGEWNSEGTFIPSE